MGFGNNSNSTVNNPFGVTNNGGDNSLFGSTRAAPTTVGHQSDRQQKINKNHQKNPAPPSPHAPSWGAWKTEVVTTHADKVVNAADACCVFWNNGHCRKTGVRCKNRHACSSCGDVSHRAINCHRAATQSIAPTTSTPSSANNTNTFGKSNCRSNDQRRRTFGGGYASADNEAAFVPTRITDAQLLPPDRRHGWLHHVSAQPENATTAVVDSSPEELRFAEYKALRDGGGGGDGDEGGGNGGGAGIVVADGSAAKNDANAPPRASSSFSFNSNTCGNTGADNNNNNNPFGNFATVANSNTNPPFGGFAVPPPSSSQTQSPFKAFASSSTTAALGGFPAATAAAAVPPPPSSSLSSPFSSPFNNVPENTAAAANNNNNNINNINNVNTSNNPFGNFATASPNSNNTNIANDNPFGNVAAPPTAHPFSSSSFPFSSSSSPQPATFGTNNNNRGGFGSAFFGSGGSPQQTGFRIGLQSSPVVPASFTTAINNANRPAFSTNNNPPATHRNPAISTSVFNFNTTNNPSSAFVAPNVNNNNMTVMNNANATHATTACVGGGFTTGGFTFGFADAATSAAAAATSQQRQQQQHQQQHSSTTQNVPPPGMTRFSTTSFSTRVVEGGAKAATPTAATVDTAPATAAHAAFITPPSVNASPYGAPLFNSAAFPPASVVSSSTAAAATLPSTPPPQKQSLLGAQVMSASGGGACSPIALRHPSSISRAAPTVAWTPQLRLRRSGWLNNSSRAATSTGISGFGGGGGGFAVSRMMKPRGSRGCLTTPSLTGGGGGGGGTPSEMTTAGGWMFKPRENPKSLFIRPDENAPPQPPPALTLALASRERHHHQQQQEDDQHQPRLLLYRILSQNAIEAGYSVAAANTAATAEDAPFSYTNLTVTREDFGSVRWLEPVSLRHLQIPLTTTEDAVYADISRVIRIEHGAVFVYDVDCGVPSPPPGEGLKRRAEVTLLGCLPKKDAECLAVRARYEDRVVRQTRKMGGDLLEYNAMTGTWRFAIQL